MRRGGAEPAGSAPSLRVLQAPLRPLSCRCYLFALSSVVVVAEVVVWWSGRRMTALCSSCCNHRHTQSDRRQNRSPKGVASDATTPRICRPAESHFTQDCVSGRWSVVTCVREETRRGQWRTGPHYECFVTDHLHAQIHAPLDEKALARLSANPTLDAPPRAAIWAMMMGLLGG